MKIGFISHLDMNLYLFRLPVMKMLIGQGHTVYAITPLGKYSKELEKEGIIVVGYSIERGSLNPIKELKALISIYRAISGLNLDVLHTFMAKPNIYGTLAGRLVHIPVIVNTVTGLGSYFIDESIKSRLISFFIKNLYRIIFSISNGVIFQNSDDQKYFEDKSLIQSKKSFLVRSSGVDTTFFDIATIDEKKLDILRDELSLDGKQVVLMIARAIWHKGIAEYVAAASLSKELDAHFILVGGVDDGNPSSASKEWLMAQKSIIWLGERNDIKELIAISSIVVLPSYREGVPRTLLEAASMRKALISTDTPGCTEVVEHEKNGLLVPIKNSVLLADAFQRLLGDEALREQFGEASRQKAVNEFDVNLVVKKYSTVYYRLLKEI